MPCARFVGAGSLLVASALACAAPTGPPLPIRPEPAVIRWTASVGQRAAGPVMVAGRVLVIDSPLVKALDPGTGSETWHIWMGRGDSLGFPSLTARGDVAYVQDSLFRAIVVSDGTTLWTQPATGGYVAADADRVYRIRSPAVQARDPLTGGALWEAVLSETFGVAATGGGVVCVAGARVLCLDAANGASLWVAFPPEPSIIVDLDIGTGSVIASTAGEEILAYDLRTGVLVWRRNLGSTLRGAAVAGVTVYACASDEEEGDCFALDESNGAVRWRRSVEGRVSAPRPAGGIVVVVDGRGIVLLDAATGRILRIVESPAEGFQDAILVPAAGVLYGRFMGRLYAMEIMPAEG